MGSLNFGIWNRTYQRSFGHFNYTQTTHSRTRMHRPFQVVCLQCLFGHERCRIVFDVDLKPSQRADGVAAYSVTYNSLSPFPALCVASLSLNWTWSLDWIFSSILLLCVSFVFHLLRIASRDEKKLFVIWFARNRVCVVRIYYLFYGISYLQRLNG